MGGSVIKMELKTAQIIGEEAPIVKVKKAPVVKEVEVELPTLEEVSNAAMAHANLNPILKMAIEQGEARRIKDIYHGFK